MRIKLPSVVNHNHLAFVNAETKSVNKTRKNVLRKSSHSRNSQKKKQLNLLTKITQIQLYIQWPSGEVSDFLTGSMQEDGRRLGGMAVNNCGSAVYHALGASVFLRGQQKGRDGSLQPRCEDVAQLRHHPDATGLLLKNLQSGSKRMTCKSLWSVAFC